MDTKEIIKKIEAQGHNISAAFPSGFIRGFIRRLLGVPGPNEISVFVYMDPPTNWTIFKRRLRWLFTGQ